MPTFTSLQIAERIGGELVGRSDLAISAFDQLEQADEGCLTFVRDQKNAERWQASAASAAIVARGVTVDVTAGKTVIYVDDADLAVAAVLGLFAPTPVRPDPGIHPSCVIDKTASIGRDVCIGPGCFIGKRVKLGDGCVLHHRVSILDDSTVGERGELFPGVVIHDRCTIGDNAILQANVVIGGDGFGYAFDKKNKKFVKIPHIGTVEIGHDVELGAGTCIDRGKFAATVVGDGCKFDNLCQVGHNVRIGKHCVFAGHVGIAGSTVVGDYVMMGGKSAIRDNITIGTGARLAACSAVMDDVPPGATWAGMPARDMRDTLRETAAIRKLPELIKLYRKMVGQ